MEKERQYYWTTKDGKKINLNDMTEDHLRNVLKLMIRRNEDRNKYQYCDATIYDTY